MPKGGPRTPAGGRPAGSTKPETLKRVPCHGISLPNWLIDWLRDQPRPAGRIIEEMLIEKYGLKVPIGEKEDKEVES